MDRTPYHLPFTAERVPQWRCPKCGGGQLTLDPKKLLIEETAESASEHGSEEWEPDWIRYVFSCVFKCSNSQCASPVACSGSGRVTVLEVEDEEYGPVQIPEDVFTPKYFEPSLVLMDIPDSCSFDVAGHLYEAFALYFADPGAAMNSCRAAVEALLTDLGVKRFVTAGGKRRSISLHQRITQMPQRYKEVSDLLLAVKWLGNAGSHDGSSPEAGDLRVTFDLLEHALSEVYEGRAKKLKAIAKKVNKKKGPVK
jgi:hypothetical protein